MDEDYCSERPENLAGWSNGYLDGGVIFEGIKEQSGWLLGANPILLPRKYEKLLCRPKKSKEFLKGISTRVNACMTVWKGRTAHIWICRTIHWKHPHFNLSLLIGCAKPNMKVGDKYLGRTKLCGMAKNEITNFDESNQCVKRDYRDGWNYHLKNRNTTKKESEWHLSRSFILPWGRRARLTT